MLRSGLAILVLLALLVGCRGGGGMTGTWRLEPKSPKSDEDRLRFQSMTITFRSDGTFTMANAVPSEGDYTVKEGEVSLLIKKLNGKPISEFTKEPPPPFVLKKDGDGALVPQVDVVRGMDLVYRRVP